jgi:uncharacterized membrane protein
VTVDLEARPEQRSIRIGGCFRYVDFHLLVSRLPHSEDNIPPTRTPLALALVLVGVVGMFLAGTDPVRAPQPADALGAIPGQVFALDPEGFLWAGLTLVVALPLGRVIVSGVGFLAAGDRRLALVSVLVLLVVGISVVAALGLGR